MCIKIHDYPFSYRISGGVFNLVCLYFQQNELSDFDFICFCETKLFSFCSHCIHLLFCLLCTILFTNLFNCDLFIFWNFENLSMELMFKSTHKLQTKVRHAYFWHAWNGEAIDIYPTVHFKGHCIFYLLH